MRKIFIFLTLLIVMLTFFYVGCSLPTVEKQINKTEKTVFTENAQFKTPAQHPAVYEAKMTNSDDKYHHECSIIWEGDEYGMVWVKSIPNEDDELYFARISKLGAKIGLSKLITTANEIHSPTLVWTGTEYGVAWFDNRGTTNEVYFTKLSSTGEKLDLDHMMSIDDEYYSVYPSLTWTGDGYGLSWTDKKYGNEEICFVRLNLNGARIGDPILISTDDSYDSFHSQVIWAYNKYGIVWFDARYGDDRLYFARIDSSGNKIGSNSLISNINLSTAYYPPSLVWTGVNYGVAWTDERSHFNKIYFAKIDGNGNKTGDDVLVAESDYRHYYHPSMVWADNHYTLVWEVYPFGYQLCMSKIDASGVSPFEIISDYYFSQSPSLVWSGTEYGVAWQDLRQNTEENCSNIYFARLNTSFDKLAQGGLIGDLSGTQDGLYYIKNVNYGTYLYGNGSSLLLRGYDSDHLDRQRWYLEDNDNDGIYRLVNNDSVLYLAGVVSGGNLTGQLCLATTGNTTNKRWILGPGLAKQNYLIKIQTDTSKKIYASGETTAVLETTNQYWNLIPAGY